MDISKIKAQLTLDEGKVSHAYQDHLGYWTIGVGRLIDSRRGGKLSDKEVDYLLANDVEEKWTELTSKASWVVSLNEARQGALLNRSFQLGVEGLLKFTTTLKYIKEGRYEEASKSMLQSLWARQTPKRAKKMSEQIRLGAWQ